MERKKLVTARVRKHWTLAQAAEHLLVDINTLSRWERGKSTPRAYNLQRLCEVYEVAASELDIEDDQSIAVQGILTKESRTI